MGIVNITRFIIFINKEVISYNTLKSVNIILEQINNHKKENLYIRQHSLLCRMFINRSNNYYDVIIRHKWQK